MVILHIEWMTQCHYLDSVLTEQGLDPQFKSLLMYHWMEESQHAKLDTLMVQSIYDRCSPEERDASIDGYLEICRMIDGALKEQVRLDFESLQRKSGREFTPEQARKFFDVQHQANRWTFLGTGMSHKNFMATVDLVKPGAASKLQQLVPMFC